MDNTIPLAPVKRIAKAQGATIISEDAVKYLRELAEEYIAEVSREAIKITKHTGRKTLKKEDIKIVLS